MLSVILRCSINANAVILPVAYIKHNYVFWGFLKSVILEMYLSLSGVRPTVLANVRNISCSRIACIQRTLIVLLWIFVYLTPVGKQRTSRVKSAERRVDMNIWRVPTHTQYYTHNMCQTGH